VEWLISDFVTLETEPELVIVFELLLAFGPLPKALVIYMIDAALGELLRALRELIEQEEGLNETFDSEVKKLASSMRNLDPEKRASMSYIMAHTYWNLKDID
jgi:hypothetical protein